MIFSLLNVNKPKFVVFLTVALVVLSFLLLAGVTSPHISAQSGTAAGYSDVDPGNSHYKAITTLAGGAVFEGTECGSNQFCPNDGITRRHFAVWLVRALEDAEPVVTQEDMSRFEDVDAAEPEAPYIVRMAELGVTKGCSANPPLYCPDQFVSRAQMASFLVRAFEMPPAERAGFEDVGEGDTHADAIDRLASIGVTKGCSADPLFYCPNRMTTRAQMASFLMRAMRWRQSLVSTQTAVEAPGAPSDLNLAQQGEDLILNWQEASGEVDYYLIQWRQSYEDFSESRQQLVYPASLTYTGATPNRVFAFTISDIDAYAVRVVSVNDIGTTASNEVLASMLAEQLRRIIEEQLVEIYKGEHPWLEEAWAHMNRPGFDIHASTSVSIIPGVRLRHQTSSATSALSQMEIYRLEIHARKVDEFYLRSYLHEMAHVYTLTNNIADSPGPLGVAYLYFNRLTREARESGYDNCDKPEEIYADTGQSLIFSVGFGGYWSACPPSNSHAPTEEAVRVVRQALSGQMPDWLYETYQHADGSLDLEAIWEEVKAIEWGTGRRIIVYQLRNEFGGYCSELYVQYSQSHRLTVRNPWRDGGCVPQPPEEVVAVAGDTRVTVRWMPPIYDGGADVVYYIVQWRGESQDYSINRQLKVQPGELVATISGLENNVELKVRIIAVNEFNDYDNSTENDGWGIASEEVTIVPSSGH